MTATSPRPLRLHLGHHFFGAGNLGDDLMLAGALAAWGAAGVRVRCTCAIPFDPAPQRLRFPQIEWLPYDPATRDRAVAACDAWVGLGGSPFQADRSTWFVDHLLEEARRCAAHGKPMYYVGVGVNEPADVAHAAAHEAVRAAKHVWTRDVTTAAPLRAIAGAPPVTAAADLSHAYLKSAAFAPPEPGTIGCVLNFEDPRQYGAGVVEQLVAATPGRRWLWLAQEDRPLPGSERALYAALPAAARGRVWPRTPDYAAAPLAGLLRTWGTPQVLVTSRFHAAIVGAWAGARVVAVARAAKVRDVAADLGMACVDDFTSADEVLAAIGQAKPVPRDRLLARAATAEACCAAVVGEVVRERALRGRG